jgi:hypothetical protein
MKSLIFISVFAASGLAHATTEANSKISVVNAGVVIAPFAAGSGAKPAQAPAQTTANLLNYTVPKGSNPGPGPSASELQTPASTSQAASSAPSVSAPSASSSAPSLTPTASSSMPAQTTAPSQGPDYNSTNYGTYSPTSSSPSSGNSAAVASLQPAGAASTPDSDNGDYVQKVGDVNMTGYAAGCKNGADPFSGPDDSASTMKPSKNTLEGPGKVVLVAVPQKGDASNMFGCMLRFNFSKAKMPESVRQQMQAQFDAKKIFAGDHYGSNAENDKAYKGKASASALHSDNQMKIDVSHSCDASQKNFSMAGVTVEKYACPSASGKDRIKQVQQTAQALMNNSSTSAVASRAGTRSTASVNGARASN